MPPGSADTLNALHPCPGWPGLAAWAPLAIRISAVPVGTNRGPSRGPHMHPRGLRARQEGQGSREGSGGPEEVLRKRKLWHCGHLGDEAAGREQPYAIGVPAARHWS